MDVQAFKSGSTKAVARLMPSDRAMAEYAGEIWHAQPCAVA